MERSRSGDIPREGNKCIIEIVDDGNEVVIIDSDSECSLNKKIQNSSSFISDELCYLKSSPAMPEAGPKRNSLKQRKSSAPKENVGNNKATHRQNIVLSPRQGIVSRKRRRFSAVLSGSLNAEPKSVKPTSKPTNFSRKNVSPIQPNKKDASTLSSFSIRSESPKALKQPACSAAEQFRSYFGIPASTKARPGAPPAVDVGFSESYAERPLTRPSTPPVDWPAFDVVQFSTPAPNASDFVQQDLCDQTRPPSAFAALSSADNCASVLLHSKSESKCAAIDRVGQLKDYDVEVNESDDADSDSSFCEYVEIVRNPHRKIYGRTSDEAIYIESSCDEDGLDECDAICKRDSSLLRSKKHLYGAKRKSIEDNDSAENDNECSRRVNLLERKEERRLQAVLARKSDNLSSPHRVFCIDFVEPQERDEHLRTSHDLVSSTGELLTADCPPIERSVSSQDAGEPTHQSPSDRPRVAAAASLGTSTTLPTFSPLVAEIHEMSLSVAQLSCNDVHLENSITDRGDNSKAANDVHLSPLVEDEKANKCLSPSLKDMKNQEGCNHSTGDFVRTQTGPFLSDAASLSKIACDSSCKDLLTFETSNENLNSVLDLDASALVKPPVFSSREQRRVGLKKSLDRIITRKDAPLTKVKVECSAYSEHSADSDQDSVHSDGEDVDLPACMLSVKHWSRKYVNKTTNLPVWEFTVYGGDDSILYSFRAFAAQSTIPGAGIGAFIEFLGASRLSETSNERRLRILDDVVLCIPKTMKPLQAYLEEGGSGLSVYLKGEDLHGNKNREYRPKYSRKKLVASIPPGELLRSSVFYRNVESVNLRSIDDIHEILDYESLFLHESTSMQPIGHLNIHTDCDYEFDESISEFFTHINCIDLGRYGPFQRQDRKPEDYFVLKSFIFSQVPVEWGFCAVERLHGMQQYIDITDDVTGLPSNLATKELPMYVNEIGHNTDRQQNVYIKDSFDSRVIKYYFMPNAPLKKGKPMELLTNYKSAYEEVRQRKGYGRRNLKHGTKSDDCLATRFERNFAEREDIEYLIASCKSYSRLSFLLQTIDRDTLRPLIAKLAMKNKLSPMQWIAIRRIQWLVNVSRRKLRTDRNTLQDKSLLDFYEPKIKSFLCEMETGINGTFTRLANHDRTSFQKEVNDAIDIELMEEVCFDLRFCLPRVLDSSIYCSVAIRLIESLCDCVAKRWLIQDSKGIDDFVGDKLLGKVYGCAMDAKNKIFDCVSGSELKLGILQFSSGLLKKYSLAGTVEENLNLANECEAFGLQHTTLPKGIIAAIVEKLENNTNHAVELGDQLVMIKYDRDVVHSEFKDLGSAPYPVSKVQCSDQINTTWYLLTQVVWIVHGFANVFLKDCSYSLSDLCDQLQVNLSDADFLLRLGIKAEDGKQFRKFLQEIAPNISSPAPIIKFHQKPPTVKIEGNTKFFGVQRPPAELVYEGVPTTKFPGAGSWPDGWTQKTYKRASGDTVGRLDHYWLPTASGPKLRSTVEVLRYLVKNMQ